MRRIKRAWCRLMHESIYFAVGQNYTCRTCGERHESPLSVLPVIRMELPKPCNVRRVDAKVAEIRRRA